MKYKLRIMWDNYGTETFRKEKQITKKIQMKTKQNKR